MISSSSSCGVSERTWSERIEHWHREIWEKKTQTCCRFSTLLLERLPPSSKLLPEEAAVFLYQKTTFTNLITNFTSGSHLCQHHANANKLLPHFLNVEPNVSHRTASYLVTPSSNFCHKQHLHSACNVYYLWNLCEQRCDSKNGRSPFYLEGDKGYREQNTTANTLCGIGTRRASL